MRAEPRQRTKARDDDGGILVTRELAELVHGVRRAKPGEERRRFAALVGARAVPQRFEPVRGFGRADAGERRGRRAARSFSARRDEAATSARIGRAKERAARRIGESRLAVAAQVDQSGV